VTGTIERIARGASLSAENFWLLACSAAIASIGLDVSSAAVVIGAMLISPLMGPILGVGLGMGITDRNLIQHSLRELALATVLSILTSALYFFISPLATPTPELVARTRPTLLDVGVAFFGGLAGIVAGSRRQQSMALPGVAIATALMPPLCTAGFGLATRSWSFFFGAFYLFSLNAIFIALATFGVVRWLRFPHHQEVTEEARRRERRLVATVATLAVLPSAYFLYTQVHKVREQGRVARFVEREIRSPGRAAQQWEIQDSDSGRVLRVFVAGRPLEGPELATLRTRLPQYGLSALKLELIQSDVSADDIRRLQGEVQRDLLRAIASAMASRDSILLARRREDSLLVARSASELAAAFPEIEAVIYAPKANLLALPDSAPPLFLLSFRRGTQARTRTEIVARSQELLRLRLSHPGIIVVER
jgi:uncharacterized hydrophobic protein (TIGR00271 family)